MFKTVSVADFNSILAAANASDDFRACFRRFVNFSPAVAAGAAVHAGDLEIDGNWRVPAFCTLVTGHLTVSGILDLQNPEGFDEGGLLIVLGNVLCRHFIGEYGKCSFIDGDLEAHHSVMNGFGDSSLCIMGGLSTRLFIGCDIWAEVGAGATMDYGVGYCLPLGYTDAARQAISPRHSEAETARILRASPRGNGYLFEVDQFTRDIREGREIFR
jgi:hypothetical protein